MRVASTRATTLLLGILLLAPAVLGAGAAGPEAFDRESAACGSTGFTTDHCRAGIAGALSLSCDAAGACAYAAAGDADASSTLPGALRLDVHLQAGDALRAAHLCGAEALLGTARCAFDATVPTDLALGACEDVVVYASAWEDGVAFRALAWQAYRACVDAAGVPTLAPLGGSAPGPTTLDLP